jgi:hypothetical protein
MARKMDYSMVDVIPVSDPNSSTMAQRVVQYQAVFQMAQSAPQIYDLPYLHRQMIETLGIKNADKIVPTSEDQKPKDPVSENMAALVGKPVKAFIYQDHDAHIAVHTAMMQDPLMAAQIGQNPQAQKMMAEIQAHISEHLAFAYRRKVEEQLGVPMPGPDEDLPEDVEVSLSRMVAMAAQQVLGQSKQQAMAQQAQQAQQDPIVQMQQAELQIKQQKLQADMQRQQMEAQLAQQKLQAEMQLKAAELQLKQRKQMADVELKEQGNVVNAYRAGVMGRSADADILRQDRETAFRLADKLEQQNAANTLGQSGKEQ